MSRGRGALKLGSWAAVGLALCAAVAVPAALLSAALAGPVADQLRTPIDGVFRFQGHGHGHGRGMSQWGAQGAAVSGIDYRTILRTYYPGTELVRGSSASPIRVLLSGAGDEGLQIRAENGLTVTVAGRSVRLPRTISGVRVARWQVRADGGRLRLAGWTDSWRPVDPTGGDWDGAELLLSGPRPSGLWVMHPHEDVAYRGELRVVADNSRADNSASGVRVVDELDIEDYLRSVVPAETPASWQPAALAAQAVAARTFARWHAARAGAEIADLCDSTACQVYPGAARRTGPRDPVESLEDPRTDAAVSATAGEELRYDGAPALAEYSDSNGGWSTAGDRPYLPARPDPWDGLVPNAAHSWEATIAASRVGRQWPELGSVVGIGVRARDGHGDWGGRVLEVLVVGEKGERVVPGRRFALSMGLRHSWWQIEPQAAPAVPSPTPTLPTIPPLPITPPPEE